MSALNTLSNNQKAQLRNAFTLIDGDSRDSTITKSDLIALYKTLGKAVPSDDQLDRMLADGVKGENGKVGISFTQFSNLMASHLSKFDDRMTIYNALKVFSKDIDNHDLVIEIEDLKQACCGIKVEEIDSPDHRLSRQVFDSLVEGFVKEQIDGKKVFLASKWLDAYID